MKKSMRIIACAAAIMISGSMFVPQINYINAAQTASEQICLGTITDPVTEAIFVVLHADKEHTSDIYYWSTQMKDKAQFPVKIEDLGQKINISDVKRIITITPHDSEEVYLDFGDCYHNLIYIYDDNERGWASQSLNYYKKNYQIKYTSKNIMPSEDTPSLVPLTDDLIRQYRENCLNEAIFTVKFPDGHSQEYYWCTAMEFPVKIEEICKDVVDPEKIENKITITPDNNKKIIVERKLWFTRIFYNYFINDWDNDSNIIFKETKSDDDVKYYTENAVREAIFNVYDSDGDAQKYYWRMDVGSPVKIDKKYKEYIDLSKVEKVINCSDYNDIILEETDCYTLKNYSKNNGSWSTIEIVPLFKAPPIDYKEEAPVIELPAGSTTRDVNNDGILNVVDLIKLKCAFLSDDEYNDSYNYDVNSDGIVSAADIAELKSILVNCELVVSK